jgi:flagellar hook-length control protein FliK
MNNSTSASSSLLSSLPTPAPAQAASSPPPDPDTDPFSQELKKAKGQADKAAKPVAASQNKATAAATPTPTVDAGKAKVVVKGAVDAKAGKAIADSTTPVKVVVQAPAAQTAQTQREGEEQLTDNEPGKEAETADAGDAAAGKLQLKNAAADEPNDESEVENAQLHEAANLPATTQTVVTDTPVTKQPAQPKTKAAASDKPAADGDKVAAKTQANVQAAVTDTTAAATVVQTAQAAVAATPASTSMANSTPTSAPTDTKSEQITDSTASSPKGPICAGLTGVAGVAKHSTAKAKVADAATAADDSSDDAASGAAAGATDSSQSASAAVVSTVAASADPKAHGAAPAPATGGGIIPSAAAIGLAGPGMAPASHTSQAGAMPAIPAPPADVHFASSNVQGIVTAIHGQLMPNGGTMSIQLDPPELGALQVTVRIENGVVSASFQTSNSEATQLLTHTLGELKRALETQGVSVERLHVHQTTNTELSSNTSSDDDKQQSASQQGEAQREHQRREMLRRMWRRVSVGNDPLDLVA